MAFPLKDNLPTRRTALVTLAIIAVNLLIWLAWQPTLRGPAQEVELGSAGNEVSMPRFEAFLFENAAISCELTRGRPLTVGEARLLLEDHDVDSCGKQPTEQRVGDELPLVPGKNVYLAALASNFMHAGFAHFFGNMLILFILGNNVEDRFGHLRYLVFYLLCGIAAVAGHAAVTPDASVPSLGASGAVAGVSGAFLMLFPLARVFTLVSIPLPFAAYMPAWIPLIFWFILQFTPVFGPNIATWAHIAGFVAGVILTPVVIVSIRPSRLDPEPRGPVFVNP